jgi:NagD protein
VSKLSIKSWLTDMYGVLVHENKAIPGAVELTQRWRATDTPFLVLTNNSIYTPRDLSARCKTVDWTCRNSASGPRRWQQLLF